MHPNNIKCWCETCEEKFETLKCETHSGLLIFKSDMWAGIPSSLINYLESFQQHRILWEYPIYIYSFARIRFYNPDFIFEIKMTLFNVGIKPRYYLTSDGSGLLTYLQTTLIKVV